MAAAFREATVRCCHLRDGEGREADLKGFGRGCARVGNSVVRAGSCFRAASIAATPIESCTVVILPTALQCPTTRCERPVSCLVCGSATMSRDGSRGAFSGTILLYWQAS